MTISEYLSANAKYLCFHCKETFSGDDAATKHFGPSSQHKPACQMSDGDIRQMERQLAEYRDEDSKVLRQMASLRGEHAQELRREEEKGYARGLADGRALGNKCAECGFTLPNHGTGCPIGSGEDQRDPVPRHPVDHTWKHEQHDISRDESGRHIQPHK